MNPLLITLTGDSPETMGRGHRRGHWKSLWNRAKWFVPGVNSVLLAQKAAKVIQRRNAKRAAQALARKQQMQKQAIEAQKQKEEAQKAAAANPTPENNAAAERATTQAAAKTALAKTIDVAAEVAESVDANSAPDEPPTDDSQAPPTDDGQAPPTDDSQAPPTDDGQAPPTDDSQAPPTDDSQAPPTDDNTAAGYFGAETKKHISPLLLLGAGAIAVYFLTKKK